MLKRYINNIGLFLGIIGLIVFVFGFAEKGILEKNLAVLYATLLLFVSALIQKEPFFTGLEGIALICANTVFWQVDQVYSLIIFVGLCFVFTMWYFARYKLNFARASAFIGLVSLCLGIVLVRNEFMVVCGVFLAIYAVFSIRQGFTVSWVFLVLNILFTVVAVTSLYGFY
ncbi:MFS transporter [Allofrancisella guangzhouensis]|uniref:MFS transporter n=1 Tax=Allofrancisella guangzhouensis TaxID=594679 RepID=A0A0A8E520_9GAMM|nr:hypothetical protein [Allofrancisella guangzhouensis]AJC49049.1 MFS transporter [Allofrancisella guangzhouensis]MBK2027461.1 MFS transporter [Allofrancisella guangzhouensis]MBK2044120.1 MFS transporter [Allofrancisella guangzhouensis]MBK2045451.1 MFS transporter [Allofrancisella guangzhouensis]